MKRDMDLVRRILVKTEVASGPLDIEDLVTIGCPTELVAYHVEMMQTYGLIDASVVRDMAGDYMYGTIDGLTWDGCDYLDAIREDAVWQKTKKVVREAVGSTTMEVIKQAAVMVATSAIKSHLGIA